MSEQTNHNPELAAIPRPKEVDRPTYDTAPLIESLKPRVEVDESDSERRIYTIEGKEITLRGQTELPHLPSYPERSVRLVGDEYLRVAPQSQFEAYRSELTMQSKDGKPELIVATQSLSGVLEAAVVLGADRSLLKMSDEAKSRHLSPEALDLIDRIIACQIIDDQGSMRATPPTAEAEALVIMSLIGNITARGIVDGKLAAMRAFDREQHAADQARRVAHLEEFPVPEGAMDPAKLAIVHATAHEPQVREDGAIILRTTGDATNGDIPRNTIHVALNHKAQGHMDRIFSVGSEFTVIAPYQEAVATNGVPRALYGVDTWWTRNPGEDLVLPGATLVDCSHATEGVIDFSDPRRIVVNREATPSDFSVFVETLSEEERRLLEGTSQESVDIMADIVPDIIDRASDRNPTVLSVLLDAESPSHMESSAHCSAIIAKIMTDYAVKKVLEREQRPYFPAGMHYLNSSQANHQLEALAVAEETGSGLHQYSPESALEDQFAEAIGRATPKQTAEQAVALGNGRNIGFEWQNYELTLGSNYATADPKTRRNLYLSGYLTPKSRRPTEFDDSGFI